MSRPRPRPRRPLVIAAIAVIVVVLAGAAVLVFAVKIPALTAGGALAQYASAIENGDLLQADQLGAAVGSAPHPVSGAVLADPGNRMSEVSTRIVSSSGDSATGTVTFQLGGQRHTATVKLARTNAQLGFLPNWRIVAPLTTTITMGVPSGGIASLNGVSAPLGADLKLTVYPGRYSVGLAADNAWFSSTTVTVDAGTSPVAANPTVTPTAALNAEVTKQVTATIDACVAMPTPTPSGCPFSDVQPGTMTGFSWKLVSYPTVTFLDSTHFFYTGGELTGNYVYTHAPNIVNRPEADPVPVSGPGSVSFLASVPKVALGAS